LIPPTVVVAAIIQRAAITTAGASDGARLQTTDFPLVKKNVFLSIVHVHLFLLFLLF
jgi:hypothetical protein